MQKINQMLCLFILLVLVTTSCMARSRTIQRTDGFDLLDYLFSKRTCAPFASRCSSNSDCCDTLSCYDTAFDAATPSGYYTCGNAAGNTPVGYYNGATAPSRCIAPDDPTCTCSCFHTA
jgi:hypothetical protein